MKEIHCIDGQQIEIDRSMSIVVLLSGGMDSTVLTHFLKANGDELHAISFDYGSKHNDKELGMAIYQAKFMGIDHKIAKLSFIQDFFISDLLKTGGDIPEGHYTDAVMKKTVVPFRNGIMLSIAAGYAESVGAEAIAIASHAGDHPIYPDCRPCFNEAMRRAIGVGTDSEVKLLAPFANKTKREIAIIGKELGVDFDMTWSCYKGGDKPCGRCGTCVERIEALIGL